jgi:hypothetical protein
MMQVEEKFGFEETGNEIANNSYATIEEQPSISNQGTEYENGAFSLNRHSEIEEESSYDKFGATNAYGNG